MATGSHDASCGWFSPTTAAEFANSPEENSQAEARHTFKLRIMTYALDQIIQTFTEPARIQRVT
jgi:hypothetical protein